MAKTETTERQGQSMPKPVVWLHGEVKTPPFSAEARQEVGMLLRMLQNGKRLGMPHAEPLPIVGPRCGALRVRDAKHNWRLMYRVDADAVIVLEVYSKKSRTIPDEVIDQCRSRLKNYETTVKASRKRS